MFACPIDCCNEFVVTAHDPEVRHLLPAGVTPSDLRPVEVTILIPALNEEITIGEFVDWCKEGLAEAGAIGQILIVDSSSDRTAGIALEHGAEVVKAPKRGLGRAYLDGLSHVRGKYLILGDADLTYDFRTLSGFVQKFREGYEYIMGSRFKGSVEEGAMPALHRYFGNPLTTWMLNILYGTRFSDIHCGMRGITADAMRRVEMQSQSWQYATEMIIKSVHLDLRTAEVPVVFHKDREGRLSHHKRIGWTEPWRAGWMTVQTIFTFGADFFLIRPGAVMFLLGAAGVAGLYGGPVRQFGIGFSLHWMLLFLSLCLVGGQSLMVGAIAQVLYDREHHRRRIWDRVFRFNTVFVVSLVMFLAGLASLVPLISEYVGNGYALPSLGVTSYQAVGGVGCVLLSFMMFTSSLVYQAVSQSWAKAGSAKSVAGAARCEHV